MEGLRYVEISSISDDRINIFGRQCRQRQPLPLFNYYKNIFTHRLVPPY